MPVTGVTASRDSGAEKWHYIKGLFRLSAFG